MIELKPCPFCGENRIERKYHNLIFCHRCRVEFKFTRIDGIELWNKRHNDDITTT